MSTVIDAKLEDKHSNLWGFHFRIPEAIYQEFSKGKDRRVICLFNGKEKTHCAVMPSPEGPFIMINQALVKKLKLQVGTIVRLSIEKDNSEYGMPVSEEFELIILGDEEVAHYFETLTPGKKRNLIHLVNKIKSSDIKINRAMAIAHHLKEDKGTLDFKRLNEVIKMYNQQNKIR